MAEVDTSSYKQPAIPSALDTVQQIGTVQQQALGIEKQKLDLMNQRYGYMLRELNSLGPDATPEDMIKYGQNIVKQGLVKPDMFAEFVKTVPTDPTKVQQFKRSLATRLLDTQAAINQHYGVPGVESNNQTYTPNVTRPLYGDVRPTGAPRQLQVPPTQPVIGPDNTPALQGPTPAVTPPGTISGPQALPVGPVTSPAVPGPSSNFGGTITGATVENAPPKPRPRPVSAPELPVAPDNRFNDTFAQAGYPAPSGPKTGMSPLFETGKQQYVEDQNLATQRLTAIKPAIQALPLIKNLTTGIGTEGFNKALAGLHNLGLVDQSVTDKVAAYQEISKKLAQYVANSPAAARSDAAQVLAEASSPNPKQQINPALIKLTKDAIILDRVQSARSHAFEGQDFTKYGEHRSTFAPKVDERAFGIDLMETKDRAKLLKDMNDKLNSKSAKERNEAQRFRRSLSIADKLGYLDMSAE